MDERGVKDVIDVLEVGVEVRRFDVVKIMRWEITSSYDHLVGSNDGIGGWFDYSDEIWWH